MTGMRRAVKVYDDMQWFSDREAWTLFKLAAFAEAFGWTLLIVGVAFQHFGWPWHGSALLLAGRLHGMFFSLYLVSALLLGKSLSWKKREVVLAALVSVPPYGTLVFEQWMAHRRKRANGAVGWEITVRGLAVSRGHVLAVLPNDRVFWCLPGGFVPANETPTETLARHIEELTGHSAKIGKLILTRQYRHGKRPRLEFVFAITNVSAFKHIDLAKTARGRLELDEIGFIKLADESFEPAFLKTENLKKLLADAEAMPKIVQR